MYSGKMKKRCRCCETQGYGKTKDIGAPTFIPLVECYAGLLRPNRQASIRRPASLAGCMPRAELVRTVAGETGTCFA
jgi:hypothetical protein